MSDRTAQSEPSTAGRRLAWGAAAALFVLVLLAFSQIGSLNPGRMVLVIAAAITAASPVAGWLVAAAGLGGPVRRWVAPDTRHGWLVDVVLGAGLLMFVDWLLLWAGALGAVTAWGIAVIGWALLLARMARRQPGESQISRFTPSGWLLIAMPALALLVGAAMLAPGAVWAGEFGGYDVLSYHLQLPREWLAHGGMLPTPHNVYGYMPNFVEAAYTHLAVWRGGAVEAALSAQMLHAMFAVLAAAAVGTIAGDVIATNVPADEHGRPPADSGADHGTPGSVTAILAAAIYLAVPWTVVTGSLAYTEQAMIAFGAVAWLLAFERWNTERSAAPRVREGGASLDRRPLAIGLLCGAAAMAKLTAVGLLVVPAGLVTLVVVWRRGPRRVAAAVGLLIAGFLAVVTPWLIRNAIWTGNPVFPMAGDVLGLGHWTAEQAARWNAAHGPGGSLAHRLTELWSQMLAHHQFGYVLIPLGIAGGVGALTRPRLRPSAAMLLLALAVQLAFWLIFTHLQSRFLLPALLPVTVLAVLGAAAVGRPQPGRIAPAVVVTILTAQSFVLFASQRGGQAVVYLDAVEVVRYHTDPWKALNELPPGSRIYAEGFATPLYVDTPVDYHTTWDRSPLGEPLASAGSTQAGNWLRDRGYTHVLIDWNMLGVWWQPGNYGYDPRITPDALRTLAEDHLRPVARWGGRVLYRVPPTPDGR